MEGGVELLMGKTDILAQFLIFVAKFSQKIQQYLNLSQIWWDRVDRVISIPLEGVKKIDIPSLRTTLCLLHLLHIIVKILEKYLKSPFDPIEYFLQTPTYLP